MYPKRIAVVIPVFNDWESFRMLLHDLSIFAKKLNLNINILVVDDCSTVRNYPNNLSKSKNIKINILRLRCNLGHQRAIAVGLCEALKFEELEGVVVMDSDGEDRVEDIFNLISTETSEIVVAKRSTRSEGIEFIAFYKIYKFIFKMLSGKVIDFGNFCYIPWDKLKTLMYSPNTWNHLAASIIKSNNPIKKIATPRGKRFFGKSKMNFTDLVLHGLGAMSVFIDFIFTRILFFLLSFISILLFIALIVLILKFATTLSIPGWTTTVIGIVLLAILQAIVIIFVSAFIVLNNRSSKLFIPAIDAPYFILDRFNI